MAKTQKLSPLQFRVMTGHWPPLDNSTPREEYARQVRVNVNLVKEWIGTNAPEDNLAPAEALRLSDEFVSSARYLSAMIPGITFNFADYTFLMKAAAQIAAGHGVGVTEMGLMPILVDDTESG